MATAIALVDLDAFFASVEELEDPRLKGKAIIVGGSPDGRGVVASASYAARQKGVHSAMPTRTALNLCPEAVVLRSRHSLYSEYSHRVMDVLASIGNAIQPVSIDEAYLDVSHLGLRLEIGLQIQEAVKTKTGLSASVGLATNKLVAKIACETAKPGGVRVVPAGQEEEFLSPLPIGKLHGVGPKTEGRLTRLGITTIGGLATFPIDALVEELGESFATSLVDYARGHSSSDLVTHREAKSISCETTFSRDLVDRKALWQRIKDMSERLSNRLHKADMLGQTLTLKIRYSDFRTVTLSIALPYPSSDSNVIANQAAQLMAKGWERDKALRLLGLKMSRLRDQNFPYQLPLL